MFGKPGARWTTAVGLAAGLAAAGSAQVITATPISRAAPDSLRLAPASAAASDSFAGRTTSTGYPLQFAGSNSGATKEPGEPNHGGKAGGHSIWWAWNTPVPGLATITTAGSDFDTLLAVYTGDALANLVTIGSQDRGMADESITWYASAGVTYSMAVDGYNGQTGQAKVNLSFVPSPANDDFAARILITSANLSVTASNLAATVEPGEPNHGGKAGGHSLWWAWTAPVSGRATLTTAGSDFDTLLAVYTGDTLTNLVTIGSQDRGIAEENIAWHASAGVTYSFAVDGYTGLTGQAKLYLSLVPSPANDDFAARLLLSGADISLTASNVAATVESGEPAHVGKSGGKSVWWSWTPAAFGTVVISTEGGAWDTLLAVYTGSVLTNLTPLVSNDSHLGDTVSFTAEAGTSYQIAVDGYNGGEGQFPFRLQQSAAQPLSSSSFDTDVDFWTAVSLADSGPFGSLYGGPYAVTYVSTNGNPGGYISMSDPDGQTWFWNAPTKLLGDQSAAYGRAFRYDLWQSATDSQFGSADLVLSGGSLTLVFTNNASPGTNWTSYSVPMKEGLGWHKETLDGPVPSAAEFQAVLSSLKALRIRGEFRNGADVGGLDNAAWVGSATNLPPPVITSVLTATGQVGVAFSYQILASNNPTNYGATPLPAGLNLEAAGGLIHGTPTAAGSFTLTISAQNASGSTTATLAVTISEAVGPAVTMVSGPGMNSARMGHSTITLPDGRVAVLGGHGAGFTALNSLEVWNPSSNAFTNLSMPYTMDGGALVRLADGRYLMAGGADNLGVAPGHNHAQIFDPASSTVSPVSAAMKHPRCNTSGALLANGKALIVGGWYDSSSTTYGEIFDPVTGQFVETGRLTTPRSVPVVLPTGDGKAVVAGGMGPYGNPAVVEQVELYDPGANAFSVLADSLFAGESGWGLYGNNGHAIEDFRLADGRYALLAFRTLGQTTEWVIALFDPASRRFTKLPIDPAFTEHVTVVSGVADREAQVMYFLAGTNSNNAANFTFRVFGVDLATGRRALESAVLGLPDYYLGSCALAWLSDGRILASGGTTSVDSRYNFNPVNKTFFLSDLAVAPPSEVLFDNGNIWGVQNGPAAATTFTLDAPATITYIQDYHYFNQGALPGTISLRHEDGTVYGPWQTYGQTGQGGVPNAYWIAKPKVLIKAGRYTVIDSDPSTWSQNAQSDFAGFTKVEGYKLQVQPPKLGVQWNPDGHVTVSWPAGATGFGLEWTDRLAVPGDWRPVAEPPVKVGDRLVWQTTPTAGRQFYRLKRP